MRHRHTPPSVRRLSELDALRGIAAFLVLVQHARVMGLDPRPFDNPLLERGVHMLMHFSPLRVLEFGRAAVLFFFVLSGYVLTRVTGANCRARRADQDQGRTAACRMRSGSGGMDSAPGTCNLSPR